MALKNFVEICLDSLEMNSVAAASNSPVADQVNEAIKNVANFNNKVGGKRKTRRNRKQTRKNRKARKATRRGGARKNNYSNCEHIYEEEHEFPSILIEIHKKENEEKPSPNKKPGKKVGPTPARRFYDCEEETDKRGETIYRGYSCENPMYDGMIIHKKDIKKMGQAFSVEDLVEWCCPS